MGLTVTPYATTAQVKTQIGIDPSDTSQDTNIDELALAVSQMFDVLAVEPFEKRSFVEYHDGGFESIFLLHEISEADAERVEPDFEVREDGVLLDSTATVPDWSLAKYPSNEIYCVKEGTVPIPIFGAIWAKGNRNIQVTYLTSFATIPSDIQIACAQESARAFSMQNTNSRDGTRIGVTSRTPATGTSMSFAIEDISPQTLRLLERYRDRRRFV